MELISICFNISCATSASSHTCDIASCNSLFSIVVLFEHAMQIPNIANRIINRFIIFLVLCCGREFLSHIRSNDRYAYDCRRMLFMLSLNIYFATKLQHFFHSCKPFFVPASVFYFCKIIIYTKSIIYKLPAYCAASVCFLRMSKKSSTFASNFKQ